MTKDKIEAPDTKADAKAEGDAAEAAKVAAELSKTKPEPAKPAEPAADEAAAAYAAIFPAEEPHPHEGGSWIRQADGTLVREEEA